MSLAGFTSEYSLYRSTRCYVTLEGKTRTETAVSMRDDLVSPQNGFFSPCFNCKAICYAHLAATGAYGVAATLACGAGTFVTIGTITLPCTSWVAITTVIMGLTNKACFELCSATVCDPSWSPPGGYGSGETSTPSPTSHPSDGDGPYCQQPNHKCTDGGKPIPEQGCTTIQIGGWAQAGQCGKDDQGNNKPSCVIGLKCPGKSDQKYYQCGQCP